MTSDVLLVRIVGVTVCLIGVLAAASLFVAEHRGIPAPLSKDVTLLVAGGLLGALTTRLMGNDPLPVATPPGEPLQVEEAADPRPRIRLRKERSDAGNVNLDLTVAGLVVAIVAVLLLIVVTA